MKKELEKIISVIASEISGEEVTAEVTTPIDTLHGDYTTNVAFIIAKGKTPREIASEIVEKLENLNNKYWEKVEVAGNGFINFHLGTKEFVSRVSQVLESSEKVVGISQKENKKIMTEFTDPNPFKPLHIGHLYSNAVGESVSRLLEVKGNEVKKVNYQGDVGLHVAKAMYMLLQKTDEFNSLENKTLKEKADFLGKCYAEGNSLYETDPSAKTEIIDINQKIYSKSDKDVISFYEKAIMWSMEYFDSIWARLGMQFNRFYLESEVAPLGLKIVKDHIKDGIFEESDGAVVFKGEKYGLHTRVFINSQGLATYEAKDLALPGLKYSEFPYDASYIFTAQEQADYFTVMLKALSLISPDLAAKTTHISHGMVRLPEGKMSSRTGNVISAEWLLDEAHKRSEDKVKEAKHEFSLSPDEIDQVAEQVAIGAMKYAFLKVGIGKDLEFSFDQSISFEGNSGPYLQYTYVRTQSILTKARNSKFTVNSSQFGEEDMSLLRKVYQFADTVEKAARDLAPSDICTYLFELAQEFNNYYQHVRILGQEDQEKKEAKLMLTAAVGIVLKQGLGLLGIQTPQRM